MGVRNRRHGPSNATAASCNGELARADNVGVEVGTIPDYAAWPNGSLGPTVIFYRRL